MVDAVVSAAVERLANFLIEEVVFLQGVKDEVEWLKSELATMQSFLKDATEKQVGDKRIGRWISEVRDLAYDSEDVIDSFILKMGVTPKRGSLASIKKCSCIFNANPTNLHKIGKDIEALKKRMDDIQSRRAKFGIEKIGGVEEGTSNANRNLRQLRRTSSHADEEHVVGFDDESALLIDKLLKGEPQRYVISILGMGGLGKTTLARKLYHDSEVERKFEHRTWISVSQEYGIRELLQIIIRDSLTKYKNLSLVQFSKEELVSTEKKENKRKKKKKKKEKKKELENLTQGQKEELEILQKRKAEEKILKYMTEDQMERFLRDVLEERRYLVVIDDVWDKEVWESLRKAFPDNNEGSRVIVTTRRKVVAEGSHERTHVHELRSLRPDESWELFCQKAFHKHSVIGGETRRCPEDLEGLARDMVEKCDGLPLAIIVLGGLLSTKERHEWHKVKRHMWHDVRSHDFTRIEQIFSLSFDDLPHHLKPCFLYLGLFPEDFEMSTWKLIRLWVAEGFIPIEERTLEVEEVAENCLNELIGRSLIQVAKTSWQGITRCRVHDLLRDIAIKKAREQNFIDIYDPIIDSASSSGTATSYRRQAAHSTIERYVSVEFSNPSLRTLLFFNSDSRPSNTQPLKSTHKRFKYLRVLDLQSIRFDHGYGRTLPDAIGELILLRYLGLKDTKIDGLPPSIMKLQALQTLDASCGNPVRLRGGADICKLKQLRHVIGHFEGITTFEVNLLTKLQTLRFVDIQVWIYLNPSNLINLRDLEIRSGGRGEPGTFTWDPIANFRHLEYLTVQLDSSMEFPSLQPLACCQLLLQLKLDGRLFEDLPEEMHKYLPNLKYLELTKSQLMRDPMPTLEKMPSLVVLELRDQNCLKKLTCTADGFPRLEVLMLYWIYSLEELELGENAMPKLKGLTMHQCGEATVPGRLRSIPDAANFKRDRD
ncbi:hypothetical protein L1049_021579 [Liquidambar formosana]|uniref:Uncharacterized protein n=1 Tax=Liquidambar formosana TaxID=63359 RepID=A0AAP0N2G1_LIQFO